jgi:predicted transcriptional regulator
MRMKVAISLPDPVFSQAEALASQMAVTRSRLYTMALTEFLERRQSQSITARLNDVYATERSRLPPDLAAAQRAGLRDEAW